MRVSKSMVAVVAMALAATMARAGVSAPFVLDTVTTAGEPCMADALPVLWNAEWIGGDTNATVVITDNGTEVKRATGSGELDWTLPGIGRHELTYTTYIDGRAQAEVYTATVYSQWKYEVEGGNATIVETTQNSGNVAIPSEIDGYPVASIGGDVFPGCSGLAAVSIPANVTSIANGAFAGCNGVRSVTIPQSVCSGRLSDVFPDAYGLITNAVINAGVESIGAETFAGCASLAAVDIPESVTSIRERAFVGCSGLTTVSIPGSITNMGADAFAGCDGLAAVHLRDLAAWMGIEFANEAANPLAFAHHLYVDGVEVRDLVLPDGVENIGTYTFFNCSELVSVTMPDSVASIGDNAFAGCDGLRSVAIPQSVSSRRLSDVFPDAYGLITNAVINEGVESIGEEAFAGCVSLAAVDIPGSVTSIGARAFSGCSGLTTVSIPGGITNMGADAFAGCDGLETVHLRDLAAWMGIEFANEAANPLAFAHHLYVDGEEVRELVVPDGVEYIGTYTFFNCSELVSVTMPDSVASIGDSAFAGCAGLRSVAIPQSVSSGRLSAVFPDAYSLITNVVINTGVASIGEETFAGCDSLVRVGIPASVTNIGERAFSGCNSLEAVNLPAGMTSIADGTFNGCSALGTVSIPDGVASIGADAFAGCSGLRAVYIRDLATWLGISFGNGAANPLACAHHLFAGGAEVTDLVIPVGVDDIKGWAFNGCAGLRSVSLPDSVTWIGSGAFAGCDGIQSVAIPQSVCSKRFSNVFPAAYGRITNAMINAGVDSIGWEAFAGCASLASVAIPESVTSIGARAFSGCSSLTAVSLPSGMTSIASGTFNGCSGLASVRIPDGVVSIGADAFAGCNGLGAVYIRDLPTWLWITFGNGAANPLACAHHLFAGGEEVTDLVIPAGVDAVKAWAFNGCSGLRSVAIPNHVASIGDGAFAGCSGIRSVAIPQRVCNGRLSEVFPAAYSSITDVSINEGVTGIAAGAFAGCTGMRTVRIPDSVTVIGDSAFADCGNLVSVSVGHGVTDIRWLAGKSRLEEVSFGDGVTEVGNGTFSACKGLRILSIGNGVTDIGWLAGHTNLERVAIGSGVKEIGIRPFAGCGKLASLTLLEGLECIVDDAFGDCVALGWVELPTTLVDWGLRSLPPPMRAGLGYGEDGFMVLNGWVLGHRDTNAPALTLPDGVAGIGNHALADYWYLATVEMPVSLKYVGRGAFETNTYLDNVVIPDGVEWVRDGAFQGCTYMRELRIGESVGRIGREAFARCTQLATVTVPDSVTEIGDGAFSGCRRMLSVKLPLGLVSPGTGMFDGCKALTGVTMPAHGFTAARLFEERYAALEAVTVAGGETVVCANAFNGCSALASVSLPDGVEKIGAGAFADCRSLAAVELPEGLESIGDGAFEGCSSLEAIVLPDSVAALGTGEFRNCTRLENVTLSRGMATVPDYSFAGCTGLASLVVPASVTNLGMGIGEWLTAVYCLGNAPGYSWQTYNSRSADVTTYVVRGTMGWDGIPSSRDLPEEWIGWPIEFWEPNRFDATFDANGGTFPGGTATYACEQITGVAYALPPYEPVLEGAVFDGWWTDPAEGAPIKATTQVNETRDIRFYAHWKGAPAAVTVRFNANGGTVDPVQGTYYATLTYGELPVPTREHYRFTGWWTAANGGNKVVASSRVPAANQELFAHWRPETYVIRFHANGGEGTMADQAFTYGSPLTLRGNAFQREGLDFSGWATSAVGAAVYADRASFSEVSAIQDGVIHLYAVWSNGGYAVRFDANGGTGRMDNQTFRFGVAQALSPNQFSRGRFRFLGWTLAPLGGVVYTDGATVRDLTASPGASVVLYAVWELPAIAEDAGVADVLEDSPDRRLKAKVTTAEAYAGFREWALGVKGPDGGVASANAVLASEHAWASYVLGAERLFGNEPEIQVEGFSVGSSGAKDSRSSATLHIRVTVKDGENAASVDADKVAALFEATRQIGDWTENSHLPLAVTAKGMEGDSLLFEVTPDDEDATSAFFRLGE